MHNLGEYTLIKPLGKGAMGEAFLAEHRLMKRQVVLKILPLELSKDSKFIHRFETHVEALARLDHPHLVKIHNVCHVDDRYFFVTDYICNSEGKVCNLAHYFEQKKHLLSEEEVLRIVRQIASALDYAHQHKAEAHGSLKLNNILIRSIKDGPQVFITDWGLSNIVGQGAFLARTCQAVLQHLSTDTPFSFDPVRDTLLQGFAFLAPEQKKETLIHPIKADIYAFGVLVYYLILGEFPDAFYELPEHEGRYKWNWNLLLSSCLHRNPQERPDLLAPALEELLSSTGVLSAKLKLQKMKGITEEKPSYATVQEVVKTELKPILKPREITRPSFDSDPAAVFQIDTQVGHYQPKAQEDKRIEPLLTQMILIPTGSYFRGSNTGGRDELPRHAVNATAFAIDMHPVTNEQFSLFLEAMGGEKDVNNLDIIRLKESRIKRSVGKLNIESGYARHPVVGVTWYGAVVYAKWVGKRLPTEVEWELASSGGKEEFLFPTGNNIERAQANFFSSDTTPIMSYAPNILGIYDMAGNVYEWCQDWYDYHYYDTSVQEPNNPKGPLQGVYRVLRGGCWKSLKEDLRCSHRHRNNPGVMNGTYGFRCAADVEER